MNPGRSDTLRIFRLVSVLINPIYKTLSTLMIIPIGFLFARNFIMITFVRGRSFVRRQGGRE